MPRNKPRVVTVRISGMTKELPERRYEDYLSGPLDSLNLVRNRVYCDDKVGFVRDVLQFKVHPGQHLARFPKELANILIAIGCEAVSVEVVGAGKLEIETRQP